MGYGENSTTPRVWNTTEGSLTVSLDAMDLGLGFLKNLFTFNYLVDLQEEQ